MKRLTVVSNKKFINTSKNEELMQKYREIVEADEKLKKEKEKK